MNIPSNKSHPRYPSKLSSRGGMAHCQNDGQYGPPSLSGFLHGADRQTPSTLLIGLAIMFTVSLATSKFASAQELFVLFTESGVEMISVEEVIRPVLGSSQSHSGLLPSQAPRLVVEETWSSISVEGLINAQQHKPAETPDLKVTGHRVRSS